MAGLDRTDFFLALAREEVDSFPVDLEDLKREQYRRRGPCWKRCAEAGRTAPTRCQTPPWRWSKSDPAEGILTLIILFSAVLLMVFSGPPRFVVPPSYRVKLVDLPPDAGNLPPTMSEQAAHAPAPVVKPQAKPKAMAAAKPAPSRPAEVTRGAMPELDTKQPPKKSGEEAEPVQHSAAAGKKQEAVTIQAPSEFPTGSAFAWYAYNVSRKITGNWKHPIVPKGTKTKVVFSILRSGIVEYVKLEDPSGIFGYDQASIRAIQISSPFPALPSGRPVRPLQPRRGRRLGRIVPANLRVRKGRRVRHPKTTRVRPIR